MSKTNQVNVQQALQDAHEEGNLSQSALTALSNIPDIGATIQSGLGIGIDSIGASEVILLSILIDDSISMEGNEQGVIDGFNMLINELKNTQQQDNIEVSLRYLCQGNIFPYTPLGQVQDLNHQTYEPRGRSTPLFKESATTLGTIIAKNQDFEDNGVQVRTITLIMTDGGDNDSGNTRSIDVSTIISDMKKAEKHIIAGMGFGNHNFASIFENMGLDKKWTYTAQSDPSEIKKAFQLFSQSATRASQSAASFSQTAMGGGFGS